jgi:hypothetical protein
MGFLGFGSKSSVAADRPALIRLPSGSFTIDPTGRLVASTLPRSFPEALVREIGAVVLATFQSAREAQLPLAELVAHFSSLKLTARELRGGAIIFLAPRGFAQR